MFLDILRKIGKFIAKTLVFIGVYFTIFAIYLMFTVNVKASFLPISFGLWWVTLWAILGRAIKKSTEDDTVVKETIGEITYEVLVEWGTMVIDVAVDTASAAWEAVVETLSNISP